jgi:hypothetical protein
MTGDRPLAGRPRSQYLRLAVLAVGFAALSTLLEFWADEAVAHALAAFAMIVAARWLYPCEGDDIVSHTRWGVVGAVLILLISAGALGPLSVVLTGVFLLSNRGR